MQRYLTAVRMLLYAKSWSISCMIVWRYVELTTILFMNQSKLIVMVLCESELWVAVWLTNKKTKKKTGISWMFYLPTYWNNLQVSGRLPPTIPKRSFCEQGAIHRWGKKFALVAPLSSFLVFTGYRNESFNSLVRMGASVKINLQPEGSAPTGSARDRKLKAARIRLYLC